MPKSKAVDPDMLDAEALLDLSSELEQEEMLQKGKRGKQQRNPSLPVMDQQRREKFQLANDLTTLYGKVDFDTGDYEVQVWRVFPKFDRRGALVGGHLATYYEPQTVDDIRREHGGGRMKVIVYGDHPTFGPGRYLIGSAKFDVAGEPKVPGSNGQSHDEEEQAHALALAEEEARRNPPRDPRDDFTAMAFEMYERNQAQTTREIIEARQEAREAREQAERRAQGAMPDMERIIETMVTTFAGQSAAQREEMRSLVQLVKGDDSAQRALLQISEAHQTELRTVRERFENELARYRAEAERRVDSERDRAKIERDDLNRSHERQIDMMRDQYGTIQKAIEASYEGRIEVLKDALASTKGEVLHFREIGTTDPLEQFSRVLSLRKQFEELGAPAELGRRRRKGDDDDDEEEAKPKSTFDRLVDMAERAMDTPAVQRMAEAYAMRMFTSQAGPPAMQAPTVQVQQLPPQVVQQAAPPVAPPAPPAPPVPPVPETGRRRRRGAAAAQLAAAVAAEQSEQPAGQISAEERQMLDKAMGVLAALEEAAKTPASDVDYAKLAAVIVASTNEQERHELLARPPEEVLQLLGYFAQSYSLEVPHLISENGHAVIAQLVAHLASTQHDA